MENRSEPDWQGGVGPWKRLTIGGWSAAAVFAAALGWTLLQADPPRPVERFESPFRDAQGPVVFSPQSFTVSPDGSMVVYRGPGPSGGTIQLWVRRWDDLDAAPVRGTVGAGTPAVSPDGRELAFSQGSEIKVLAFEGGPIRTLTPGSWLRWGPDGYIYASVARGTVRVPMNGGPADTLTQITGGDVAHIIFDFLPGGESALLHVTLPGGEFESRAIDLATGEMKPLKDRYFKDPRPSPALCVSDPRHRRKLRSRAVLGRRCSLTIRHARIGRSDAWMGRRWRTDPTPRWGRQVRGSSGRSQSGSD
jgi:hypothetical protein